MGRKFVVAEVTPSREPGVLADDEGCKTGGASSCLQTVDSSDCICQWSTPGKPVPSHQLTVGDGRSTTCGFQKVLSDAGQGRPGQGGSATDGLRGDAVTNDQVVDPARKLVSDLPQLGERFPRRARQRPVLAFPLGPDWAPVEAPKGYHPRCPVDHFA